MNIEKTESKKLEDDTNKVMNLPAASGVSLGMLSPPVLSNSNAGLSSNEHRCRGSTGDDSTGGDSDSERKRRYSSTAVEPTSIKRESSGASTFEVAAASSYKKARKGSDESESTSSSFISQQVKVGRTSTILHNDLMATYDNWLEHADHLIKENISELPQDIIQQASMPEQSEGADSFSTLEVGSCTSVPSYRTVPIDDVRHRLALMLQECNIKINTGGLFSRVNAYKGAIAEEEEHEFDEVVKNFMNEQKLPGQTDDIDESCSDKDVDNSGCCSSTISHSATTKKFANGFPVTDFECGKQQSCVSEKETLRQAWGTGISSTKVSESQNEMRPNIPSVLQTEDDVFRDSNSSPISEPNENDVICEDNASSFHLGNARFCTMLHQAMLENRDVQSFAYAEVGMNVAGGSKKDMNSKKSIYSKRSRSESPNQGASFKSNRAMAKYKLSRRTKSMPGQSDDEDERRCERRLEVARTLVNLWHAQSPPGRFIEKSKTNDSNDGEMWRVVENPLVHVQSWLLTNPMNTLP